jgi:hypothetical protein
MSLKVPIVLDAERSFMDGGQKAQQSLSGIGDVTRALPLKKYFNLDGRSGHWGMTPQLSIPLSGADQFDLFNREFGTGLTLGYGSETYRYLGHVWLTGYVYHGDMASKLVARGRYWS